MGELLISEHSTTTITPFVSSSNPIPTTGSSINSDVIKKLNDILGGEFVYNEKTSSFHNGSVALIPIYDKSLTESMSIQGSCFMCTREMYNKLNLCDESYGSWGNQGIEVACKTWLSGGKVIINHKTWYAHMFRTNGDWCPDYLRKGGINTTKKKVWDDILNYKLNRQIHPVSWLVERFMPVPGWDENKINQLK
jgi:hypothetical protein